MHPSLGLVALISLSTSRYALAGPVGKATIAVHGSGTVDAPLLPEYHSLIERAPVGNKAPNITDRAWINGVLARVALWRERHLAVPLVWSTTLAQFALDSANKCQLAHTGGPYVSAFAANRWLSILISDRARTSTGYRRPQ